MQLSTLSVHLAPFGVAAPGGPDGFLDALGTGWRALVSALRVAVIVLGVLLPGRWSQRWWPRQSWSRSAGCGGEPRSRPPRRRSPDRRLASAPGPRPGGLTNHVGPLGDVRRQAGRLRVLRRGGHEVAAELV